MRDSAQPRARCCAATLAHCGCKTPVCRRPRGVPAHHRAPPGGIAGGDRLDITAHLAEGAWAQLTSPGAAKWYRASGPAYQQVVLTVEAGATLEWLPQETIVFSAAQAELSTRINLEGNARLFYWDVVALGRPASGERFDRGHFQSHLDIRRDGQLLWHERQRIVGDDGLLDSPIGLDGQPVFATLLVSGKSIPNCLNNAVRCRMQCVAT